MAYHFTITKKFTESQPDGIHLKIHSEKMLLLVDILKILILN